MMDSLLQSSLTMSSIVRETLECEKEVTRRWLRAEINSLVDPLIDSLFGKLTDKLTSLRVDNATSIYSSSYHHQSQGQHQHNQLEHHHHNPNLNPTSTSTSFSIDSFNQVSQVQDRTTNFNGSPIRSNLNPLEGFHFRNFTFSDKPQNKDIFEPLVQIKQEITDDDHETKVQIQSSNSNSKLPETFEEEVEVEIEDEEEDEECDCDDCLNGGIIDLIKGEEGYHDDDDEVQVIDDDEPFEPKRPRLRDPVSVHHANHRPTVENQIITHSLKCLQVDCCQMFTNKDKMYEHLKLVHTIGRYRCLVNGCHGSFDKNCDLGQHMKDNHSHLTQFSCSQCSKNFRTYQLLFKHKSTLHFLGHFQCSFPLCTFVGQSRVCVFGHYSRAHKCSLVCSHFPACSYRTLNATKLKAHERAHAGIEPYRCKWPGCSGYAHASRDAALAHIRSVHLNAKKMGYRVGATVGLSVVGDPRDYLEVVQELIH